jgi:hypothetical protein
MVLVFEDLHGADAESLARLEQVPARPRLTALRGRLRKMAGCDFCCCCDMR